MTRSFEQAAAASLPTVLRTSGGDVVARVGFFLRTGWSVAGVYSAPATTAAGAAASLAVSVVAPAFALFAAVYSIGRISERAEDIGKYNAFLTAFAQSTSDFSRGIDRRRRNAGWPDASIRGRNTAIQVLTELGPEQRRIIFAMYRKHSDQVAVQAIVARLGGYLTR